MSLILVLLGCPLVTDADVQAALDRDGDGFVGAIHGGDDCNDDDPRAYPGAPDPWYDGVILDCERVDDFDADLDGLPRDEDCDDDDPDVQGPTPWYVDADFDSAGAGSPVVQCDPGAGWAATEGDCDDANSNLHPLATERCNGVDDDCDGFIDDDDPTVDPSGFVTTWEDRDGDGVGTGDPSRACVPPSGWAAVDGDCDDDDPNNTPGVAERCDGVDNDCDGLIDDDDINLAYDEATWYLDDDGDGYGDDATADPMLRCFGNVGESNLPGDCDDRDDGIHPGADEICDGIDNDCDGVYDDSDPGAMLPVWYLDNDGDGVGDAQFSAASCLAPPGYVARGDDCDDADTALGAPTVVLADLDGDGWGGAAVVAVCDPPPDAIVDGGDCDDGDSTIHPAATEVFYDGVDQDCDGASDYDADGDGQDADTWGGDDCDDTDPAIWRGAAEVWYDGVDQDCAGDDDFDQDGDHFVSEAYGGTDCDDTDPLTWPDAPEIWGDGIDQDCGLFDDLDVDMDGLPDLDGCTTVARIDVDGVGLTLAAALAGAGDCTELRLAPGVHPAVDLAVGTRRILVRGDEGAILAGTSGHSMFTADRFLGLANLTTRVGGDVVSAGTNSRITVSDLLVQGHDDGSFAVDFSTGGDLWMVFTRFDRTGGAVRSSGGATELTDIVATDIETIDFIDVDDASLVVNRLDVDGAGIGTVISSNRSQVDVRDVYITHVDGGAAVSMTDVDGVVEGLTIEDSAINESSLHANTPGSLVVRDITLTGCSLRPWFAFGLLWLEQVDGAHISLVGNDISGFGFGALTVDANEDGTTLSNVLIAGNLVDVAMQCFEPTPTSFATIAANTGGGVYSDCQLRNSIVAYNGTFGFKGTLGVAYTDTFGNAGGDFQAMVNPVGSNGNLGIDPELQTVHPNLPPAYLDVHLRADSPLRDAGDPAVLDVDGTVADLGAYGGPDGEDDLLDSELDGLPDGWELRMGLDPAIDDALEDPDGDGLDNLGEYLKGTRPDINDTDADGVDDLDDDAPFDPDDA